jgi:hypothetical protein
MDKWTLFRYEDGSNPYIAKTEKEKNRILKKYGTRAVKIDNDNYFIKNIKQETTLPLF